MPRGSQRPFTRRQVRQNSAMKSFARSGKTRGITSDLFFAEGIDKLSGKKRVLKKTQKRKR